LKLGERVVGLGFYTNVAALGFCFEHSLHVVKEAGHFDGRGDDLKEVGVEFGEDEDVVDDSVED
jgi:hypothetical protein